MFGGNLQIALYSVSERMEQAGGQAKGTTMAEMEQRHTRLALVDLLVLTAAFALAFSWLSLDDATWNRRSQEDVKLGYREPETWPGSDRLFYGTVLGLCFSGPMVLVTQGLFLGRHQRLTRGEWLWLSPSICYLVGVGGGATLANSSQKLAMLWVCCCFVVQLSLGFFAGVVLFVDLTVPKKGRLSLPWTHTFGCIACLAVSVSVVLIVLHEWLTGSAI